MKQEEKKKLKQKMLHTENNEKKDIFPVDLGWPRNVEHCLWPPTSWQFACCGFQRAQLLSQFIWIRWTHVLLLSCLFWTRFLGCLFFKTCKCLEVRCVPWEQNCFCLPSSLHDLFCLHVTRVVSRLNHPAGSIFCAFLLLRLCVFLSSWIHVPISLLAVSLLVCEVLATLVYFSGAVGDTWRSRHCRYVHLRVFRFAPRVALACSVSFPSPVCFSCTAFAGSGLVKDGVRLGDRDGFASLSTSCWDPWGCEHRDGFQLGFFLPSLVSAGCSFLPPDVVRASSLWHVLRILTLFLALTGTMALHVLKLDGVSASARHVWRDLMVSFVSLYFCWPLLRFEVASVPGRFLHGTQDPELCASWSCSVSARSVPLFLVAFSLSPCSQGHIWNFRALVRFVGPFFWCLCLAREVETWHPFVVSFSVLPFSASLCLVGFPTCPSVVSGSRRCGCHVCFYWGMYGAFYGVFCSTLESREFLSDDQQLLNAGLHLSRPRTVIFWYGSSRCQQLLLSAWLEVVVIYPVRLWIYSLSSRDFSLCLSGEEFWVDSFLCGVAAVLQLDTLHVAMMLLQPPRGSCCFLVQLLSVIPLSFRLRYMVLSFRSVGCAKIKNTHQKWENCDKKERSTKSKQKTDGTHGQ